MTQKEIIADRQRIDEYINTPGKLAMHAFRKKFSFDISYGMAGIELDNLTGPDAWYLIDWDVYLPSIGKNLQRGFVWDMSQKQELIISVLKGIFISPITVIMFKPEDRKQKGTYRIVDGKQRLSTLLSYFNGEFGIPFMGKLHFYDDLTKQAQREINGCVRSNIAYEYEDKLIPDSEKIAWFEQINFAGTPQDLEHLKYLKS